MTTNPKPNVLKYARQGNPKAIAALVNRQLQSKGITAKVSLQEDCLIVLLESNSVPNKNQLIPWIKRSFESLNPNSISKVKIYGKEITNESPDWQYLIQLQSNIDLITSNQDVLKQEESLVETKVAEVKDYLPYSSSKSSRKKTSKSKVTAGLLAIFFGGFGAHYFYLGSIGWGFIFFMFYMLLIPSIIGLISGIRYLLMSQEKFEELANEFAGPFGIPASKFLKYFLWFFFGLVILISFAELFNSETTVSSSLKLAISALIIFPPVLNFISYFFIEVFEGKNFNELRVKEIIYLVAFLLFVFIGGPLVPGEEVAETQPSREIPTQAETAEDYPGQTEVIEEFGRERYEELDQCQDEMIAKGATAEELLKACNSVFSEPSNPSEEPSNLSKQEVEQLLCEEVMEDPSHPWYLDCIQKGY